MPNDRVRRIGTELFVIVSGVLLALGAQAAAQEWSDRRREGKFIDDLVEEFVQNEARLLTDLELTRKAVAAAELWRAGVVDGSLSHDSLAVLYAASLNPARFDPVSGHLRSLIDGGELGLIRDARLRAELAGWPDLYEEQRLTYGGMDMFRANLAPVIVEAGGSAPPEAMELDRLALLDLSEQQEALLGRLRQIRALLEEQTAR